MTSASTSKSLRTEGIKTVIGITGKIGSGKTTVMRFAEKMGAHGIDCDQLVHELYEPGQLGATKIQAFFEDKYVDKEGRVNRKKLLRELFNHPKKWEVLNRMIHPLVAEKLRRRLRKIKRGVVVIEIPIYTTKIFKEFVDELWIMELSPQIQRERLANRELNTEQIEAINKQNRPDKHLKTYILENNGTLEELKNAVKTLLKPHL